MCYSSNENSDSKWSLIKDLKKYNSDHFELGPKDKERIIVCIKSGHTSTLEHSLIHFEIQRFPRSILQEVVRHRIGISYSVQSTRFTLRKELKKIITPFHDGVHYKFEEASKFIYLTGVDEIDKHNTETLELIRTLVHHGEIKNDVLKQLLPEAYCCDFRVSYNHRSLRHFLELRSNSDAHYLIRELTKEMYKQIPDDQKFLYQDIMNKTLFVFD